MSAREETNQNAINDVLLANNDFADFVAYQVKPGDGKLEKFIGLHSPIVEQRVASTAPVSV